MDRKRVIEQLDRVLSGHAEVLLPPQDFEIREDAIYIVTDGTRGQIEEEKFHELYRGELDRVIFTINNRERAMGLVGGLHKYIQVNDEGVIDELLKMFQAH